MEALSDRPKATLPSPGTQSRHSRTGITDRCHGLSPKSGLWQDQCCYGCAKIITEEIPYSKTIDIFYHDASKTLFQPPVQPLLDTQVPIPT